MAQKDPLLLDDYKRIRLLLMDSEYLDAQGKHFTANTKIREAIRILIARLEAKEQGSCD